MFIEVKIIDGRKLLLNTKHILSVSDSVERNITIIGFVGGTSFRVEEPFADVLMKIKNAS